MSCPPNIATVLFKSVQVGILIIDVSTHTIVDVNPSACVTLGLKPEDLLGKSCVDQFCGKEAACPFVAEGGVPDKDIDNEELVFIRKDGSAVTVLRTAVTAYFDGRKHVVETLVNVTDRKNLETKYADLVKYAPAGIYELDLRLNKFTAVNDVMLEYMEYSREEFLNLSAFDILTEKSKLIFLNRLQAMGRGEEVASEVEYEVVSKTGRKFWVLLSANYLLDDGNVPQKAFCIVIDITDRKIARDSVERERNKAQMYLDMAFSVFIGLDRAGNITLMNKYGCDVLGIEECFLLGRNWFEDFIPPEERETEIHFFNALLSGSLSEVVHHESNVVARNGDKRLISWKSRLIHNGGEEAIGVFSSGDDITDQRRYEQELASALNKLDNVIGNELKPISSAISVRISPIDREIRRNKFTESLKKLNEVYYK